MHKGSEKSIPAAATSRLGKAGQHVTRALAIAAGAALGAVFVSAATSMVFGSSVELLGGAAGLVLGALAGFALARGLEGRRTEAYWAERPYDDSAVGGLDSELRSRPSPLMPEYTPLRRSLGDVAANPELGRTKARNAHARGLGELAAGGQ